VVDLFSSAWYKLTAVKNLATTASKPRLALGATLDRGNFTAYYWRFT
jgi:hypothetical protein